MQEDGSSTKPQTHCMRITNNQSHLTQAMILYTNRSSVKIVFYYTVTWHVLGNWPLTHLWLTDDLQLISTYNTIQIQLKKSDQSIIHNKKCIKWKSVLWTNTSPYCKQNMWAMLVSKTMEIMNVFNSLVSHWPPHPPSCILFSTIFTKCSEHVAKSQSQTVLYKWTLTWTCVCGGGGGWAASSWQFVHSPVHVY